MEKNNLKFKNEMKNVIGAQQKIILTVDVITLS